MSKRVYIFFLFIIILFSINAYAYLNGDVDGDNKVNSADYILVRKHLMGSIELTGDKLKRADVNSDGKVSTLDYVSVRKIILNGDNIGYTVTFDSVGGSVVSSQMIDKGGKVDKPDNPTLDGYDFLEWRLNGETYDFNKTISSNITLKAVWIASYKLKTNDNIQIPTILPNSSNITYSSSNEQVVKVDKNGMITAIGAGYAKIVIMSGNNGIARIDVNVDYGYFDTCKTSKSNTKVVVNTSKNRPINIYSCIENQKFFHQGIAVTNDSIIYTGASYETWCQPNNTYNLKKYNLSGECNSQDDGVAIITSGNYIKKYDKKTGKYIINYLDVGGHGQASDATSNNELYMNYFPKLYLSKTYGYGSHTTGIAYIKQFVNNKEYLTPNTAFLLYNNGNFSIYKSSYKVGTMDYLKDIVSKSKNENTLYTHEFAVDEDHDQIAVVNKDWTTNSNITLYIYKLSDFINGKKTLKGKYYIGAQMCYGKSSCFGQGMELYGDYVYSVEEIDKDDKHYEGVSKFNYKTCPRVDQKTSTCDYEELVIPANKIGTEYGTGFVGLSEIEGISVIKGKVYVGVITNAFSDDYRRNITLLLDEF